jgi:hypothetical protein
MFMPDSKIEGESDHGNSEDSNRESCEENDYPEERSSFDEDECVGNAGHRHGAFVSSSDDDDLP